jgi:glycosyltransferase involved in cell wall biosynthesis
MARIAVNTRLLLKGKLEGIGWFTYETLKRITEHHPEHTFLFIFDRPYDPEFIFGPNVIPIVAFPQARHPILYYWYFEFSIPSILKKHKADYFLSPDGYCSLRAYKPTLTVIHDINFEHRPKDLPLKDRLYYRRFFPKFAHKAKRIATVSEFSKRDIAQTYSVDPSKIDVVYNGCNSLYEPIDKALQETTRIKWSQGKPYFLFIGSLHPRKNLLNLIKAFDRFCQQTKTEYRLLIVGNFMWKNDLKKAQEALLHKDKIILTGRLSNDELKPILGSASALTYVPFFEGFGIPILEGFAAGIPVITSNTTSMPEVAGNAALLVKPDSIEEISNAMLRITTDSALAQQLISAGFVQKEKFSWDKSAELLWQSIEKLMQEYPTKINLSKDTNETDKAYNPEDFDELDTDLDDVL